MGTIKVGDIVTRKSHNHDIQFKIVNFNQDGCAELKGVYLRLRADAPMHDLVKVRPQEAQSLAAVRQKLLAEKIHRALRHLIPQRIPHA